MDFLGYNCLQTAPVLHQKTHIALLRQLCVQNEYYSTHFSCGISQRL